MTPILKMIHCVNDALDMSDDLATLAVKALKDTLFTFDVSDLL